jgi:nucleotide-binding universal stress UspA family protein
MRFGHVLVPIDLSDRNARLLGTALALAQVSGARVTLLHVVHRIKHVPVASLRGFYGRLKRTSARKLERAAQPFLGKGLKVRTVVRLGNPPLEIVRLALRQRVDLVVMGSHRVNPARPRPGFGTTSYKVALACQCPILLVK